MDIMMPKLNGLDLVRRLRRGGDTTPVLFLTARDSVADRVEVTSLSADQMHRELAWREGKLAFHG